MMKSVSILLTCICLVKTGAIYAQQNHEKQLQQSISSESNSKKKFRRMIQLGNYYKATDLKKADSMRHVILDYSSQLSDTLRFDAVMFDAEISKIRGDLDAYFNTILSSQSFINKLGDDQVSLQMYAHLGYYNNTLQDFELSMFFLRKALDIANKNKDYSWRSRINQLYAETQMLLNNKDSALLYAEKGINTARRSSDRVLLAKAFNVQATIYLYFGQVELSVAKNLIALQVAEENRNHLLVSQISREIGQAQKLIHNLRDASYYFTKSYDHAKAVNDYRQMALSLSELAGLQLEYKDFKSAMQNANKALEFQDDLNDKNGMGETREIIGRIYREQGDYNLALSNFNQALVYFESTNNREKIAEVYHDVGSVFKAQGKYTNALNYLFKSIEIREQFGAKSQVYHSYRIIADIYKATGKTAKALDYMELYLNYHDSNTVQQSATKIAELSESYRAEQRERLISSQADSLKRQLQEKTLTATKLENSQLRNNFQTYIIIAFAIIMLLAGIVVRSRWKQSIIKQQQHEAEMSQKLLRLQMNPHFVFNAMSVIQSYLYDNDTVNSTRFLVNFSRLMRLILENSPKELIPIEVEIEILKKYLEVQKMRFQERFTYEVHAEEELFDELVVIPPMITQPFIENAIEHGQLHRIEGGYIKVAFQKVMGKLQINIEDNGIGRKASKKLKKTNAHKSMAMDITQQRIDTINRKNRSEASLLVEDLNPDLETGTKVLISLPYTTESELTAEA